MVEAGLNTIEEKDEFQQIMELIRKGNNFLLSGGAGSGKTYSLVQVIKKVIDEFPTAKVACMTYTNSAVKEIEERVNHENLKVTTIHDFLWDNIKNYQKELKNVLIELINDDEIDKIKLINNEKVDFNFFNEVEEIKYSYQRTQLFKGIISHDELLIISNRMFKNHKLLCDIVKDKFNFIFIDEYQDSHPDVVEIFLEYLTKSNKKNIIGCFGDSMQSIYNKGIGDLNQYTESGIVHEVLKVQNRRNPKFVIDLANRLRTDGITQEQSNDITAPNMNPCGAVKLGKILFLYSTDEETDSVKDYLKLNLYWDFDNTKETKELNLTHNLIATKAGFQSLMDIYDKDQIIGFKNNILEKIKDNQKYNKPEVEISVEDTFENVIGKFDLNSTPYLIREIELNEEELSSFNAIKGHSIEKAISSKVNTPLMIELLDKVRVQKKIPKKNYNLYSSFEDFVEALNFTTKVSKINIVLRDSNNLLLYNNLKDKPFSEIRKIYLDKDSLIDDKKQDNEEESKKGSKRDKLIKHLFKIQTNIYLYQSNLYNEFLKHTEYKITRLSDKKILSESIQDLINVGDKSIEDIINLANDSRICLIDSNLNKFMIENEYIYDRVKAVKYKEFQFLYDYLEGKTPFSTQHKVKGDEFDNVLVVLDNGNWNDYNFEYLFDSINQEEILKDGKSKTKSKLESFYKTLPRTQKIFYVCCTRAKENLAVYYSNPSQNVIDKAKEWFGEKNVISLDELIKVPTAE
ncbi:UvrD-helicase domain-containing protein [Flavobacterium ovatum]|uniref:UvrD-helicase domain-containing protein n=1 Tax=Flavobacterium ovatum TaxID=1928857 RepID=UPI00344CCC24